MFFQRRTLTLFKRDIDSNIHVVSNKNAKNSMCHENPLSIIKAFFLNEIKSRGKVIALTFYIETEKTMESPRSALDFHPGSLIIVPNIKKYLNGWGALKPHLLLVSCWGPFPLCNFNFHCVE